MNIIIHQFKKDLGQQWPWVALWLGACAIGLAPSWLFNPQNRIWADTHLEYIQILYLVSFFAKAVLLVVLVAHLIQSESLVGTTAFWLTRPLERWKLLLAKSLFVGLIIVMPVLAANSLLDQTIEGFKVDEDLRVFFFLNWMLALSLLVLMAALTPDLPRFFLWSILGIISSFFAVWIYGFILDAIIGNQRLCAVNEVQRVCACVLTIFGAASITAYLYLTRNHARAIAAFIVLVAVMLWFVWV